MMKQTHVLFLIVAGLAVNGCTGGIVSDEQPPPPKATSTRTAAVCFNPALAREGTHYRLQFARILPGLASVRSAPARAKFTINGTETIDGTTVTLTTSSGSIGTGGENRVSINQRIYRAVDVEQPALRHVRTVTQRNDEDADATSTVTQTFDPPRLFQFDLRPGESYTQSYVRRTVRRVNGDEESEQTQSIEATTTFVGLERVRGASGPVTACRFEQQRRYGEDRPPTTHIYWIDVEMGLTQEERVLTDGEVQRTNRLLRATIDGTPQ